MVQPNLEELMAVHEEPCISIFMPVRQVRSKARENPIRYKNLIASAEQELDSWGMRPPDKATFMSPARGLMDDPTFWRCHHPGLAFFLSSSFFRSYELPIEVDERAIVGDRFYLKPLLSCLIRDKEFYLLALSQNSVRLYACNRYEFDEIKVVGLPEGISDALKYDDPERQLQFHTKTANRQGDRDAVFHGHGVGKDDRIDRLLRYFRLVDQELHPLLAEEQTPLVVAGVDYLLPLYGQANTYAHLVNGGVAGHPDEEDMEEVHSRALQILEPILTKDRDDALKRFAAMRSTKRASCDLPDIVSGACHGRVDTLFAASKHEVWGTIDQETVQVHVHRRRGSGDQDLVDRAAAETLAHSGRVYLLSLDEMPDSSPLAAIFRY